jgi:putative transposase
MTTQFKRLSHSIYECKYHLVFCPKYRYRVLHGEVAEHAGREIQQLCKYKDGVEILEMNIQSDHIHLVLSIAPKYAVSNVMGYLKGKLALRLFDQYEHLGKRYWGRHLWSRGYCVSTVGLDEERIRKYVRWQEEQEKRYKEKQGRLFD